MTTAKKRAQLLQMAIKADVAVDRWDNIRWSGIYNKEFRFNFKKTVVRIEFRLASENIWHRINSHNIKDVSINWWKSALENIYNSQNNIR